jgi:CubicO group peptidase (beta-lactamase class C family)
MIHDQIEALIQAQFPEQGAGIAVAVVKDAGLVHAHGYGYANLEWQIPIGTDTVFRLGSITKQFTATAIMLLVSAGKLRLDDPLTTFLPDYPTAGHDVRVHHLLTHTSGIKSYTSMPGFFEHVARQDLSPAQLTAYFQDEPFEFAPGDKFTYNNSGYVLLGRIIEHLAGVSYADFIQQHIFAPLGMRDSAYLSNEAIVPRRASGYQRTPAGYRHAPFLSMTLPYAAGALGSTIDDLVRWDMALREQQLLDRATLERMVTPVTLNDGSTENYGLGWGLGTYYGHPIMHHGGGINGFRTYIARFPEAGAAVMLLGNCNEFEPEPLGRRISKLILGIPVVQPTLIGLDAQGLAKLTGTYAADTGPCEVTWDGQHLKLAGPKTFTLLATSPTTFVAEEDDDVAIRFAGEADGQFTVLMIAFPFFTWTARRTNPRGVEPAARA